jgi:[ribosomal protein S5]-alanine N-acetyltransferase
MLRPAMDPVPDPPSTRRVTLRAFREEDAAALHPIFADTRAMRYWSTPPHADFADTLAYVRATIAATEAGRGDDQVVLFEGRVIGKAGLWDNQEVGFIFSPAVWGMGLAGEALGAVIDRARHRGVARIRAEADPRNEPCLRLVTRAGFVETGRASRTMKVGNEWVDSVYLELALS